MELSINSKIIIMIIIIKSYAGNPDDYTVVVQIAALNLIALSINLATFSVIELFWSARSENNLASQERPGMADRSGVMVSSLRSLYRGQDKSTCDTVST